MFNKNSLSHGLLIGMLVPIIAFGLIYGLFIGLEALGFMSEVGFRPYFRERTTSIIAIAINAIMLNRFYKLRYTDSMRGIVIMTFVYILIWIILFWNVIFGGGTLPLE